MSKDGSRVMLNSSQLVIVPEWLSSLDSVTTLDLSDNELSALPEWLGSLATLTALDLRGNRLERLPSSIGRLASLTKLYLSDNRLASLPDSIGNLPALTALDLRGNRLSGLPESVENLATLATLNLSRNRLIRLPDSIGSLTTLVMLDVRSNQLTQLPDSMGNLTALTTLDLGYNKLSRLPESIGKFAAIKWLNLDGLQLTSLPESFGNLTSLTRLILRDQQLTDLPESIGGLTSLTTLDLKDNKLTRLPESIGKLTSLTTLNLIGNQLTRLPKSIGNLVAITTLYLNGNQLTRLPDSIGQLVGISKLDLSGHRLTVLPKSIGNLTSLTSLDLSSNLLTRLPESIGNLTALTEIKLNGNQLTALPESIENLTALSELDLNGHQLSRLPESIGSLASLTSLDLRNNQLTRLPESIGSLASLTSLDLRNNQLTRLPESIGSLASLTSLDLRNNQLTRLPESIGSLASLTSLDLRNNQITLLPRQLADLLTRGLTLDLADNPLNDPLPEIVGRGSVALASYLSSLEEAITQFEAKLLLVGEGNVGKTSLVAALRGMPFITDRPTTHGVEISSFAIRHPGLNMDITLRAWDFGGQEVYRISHQFFYSRRALYLVVWNPREGQEHDEVEGWLRRIRARVGKDISIILIATHCDDRLSELDYGSLQKVFPGMLAGSFEIDNKTSAGLSQLRAAIAREAANLPQMGQEISSRWIGVRDEMMARAKAEPHISYDQFAETCEQNGVTGSAIITLAELMHDLGYIIYYGEDEGLKDVVVLNPEWLTQAISYVLEDKPTKDADGILEHARLKSIWRNREDGSSYPVRYHPYLLRLMEKFDISYRIDGDELRSLVAQLVPHERPPLPWESWMPPPAGIRTLKLMCRLSEVAPGLIPWLTVRHHRASTGIYWRRGVFLRHPIEVYDSEALLELHHSRDLFVEVRAPSPDFYFNALRDSIEDLIARRWPGLTYRLFIPCPSALSDGSKCAGQFLLATLELLRQNEVTTVPCMECATQYEISLLLTGFASYGQSISERLTRIEMTNADLKYGVSEALRRIADVKSGVIEVQRKAAEIAEIVRSTLRAVSIEVPDCPRLFTLESVRPAGGKRLRFDRNYYRLTLWCEYSEHSHDWEPATYEFDRPKQWFIQISPYAKLIFRILRLAIPLAGSIEVALLPENQIERAQARLEAMNVLIEELPDGLSSGQKIDERRLDETTGRVTEAEGSALRLFRSILFEHDPERIFGGMRRTRTPSGDFLWVCPKHYGQYDPGLPVVP